MNIGLSDSNGQPLTTSTVGYMLLILGLSITLFAMALDQWTGLRGLELTSGYVGLIISIIAAIISASDMMSFASQAYGPDDDHRARPCGPSEDR